jgi:hypothetical protein
MFLEHPMVPRHCLREELRGQQQRRRRLQIEHPMLMRLEHHLT